MIMPQDRQDKIDLHQIRYKHYIDVVYRYMETRNVRILTPVWITQYFGSWKAIFGGSDGDEDHYYILRYEYGEFDLETQRPQGFRPNGTLIINTTLERR